MSDPNNLFIRERQNAGTQGVDLPNEQVALYTNAGAPSGDVINAFQPFAAPGGNLASTGEHHTTPDPDLNNTVLRAQRSRTNQHLAISKSRTLRVFPLTGGVLVAEGLLGPLGATTQDAHVGGVYNMQIDQPFSNAPERLFVASRQDERDPLGATQRGALEWQMRLPVIEGSGSDSVSHTFVFVRNDATAFSVQWRYSASDQSVALTVEDSENTVLEADGALSGVLGAVVSPSSDTLELYLDGTYIASVPLQGTPTLDVVALFHQSLGIFDRNPLARFYGELAVDANHFLYDYNAGSL